MQAAIQPLDALAYAPMLLATNIVHNPGHEEQLMSAQVDVYFSLGRADGSREFLLAHFDSAEAVRAWIDEHATEFNRIDLDAVFGALPSEIGFEDDAHYLSADELEDIYGTWAHVEEYREECINRYLAQTD